MDRDDPNTWTKDFVLAHRADCLRHLQMVNSQVVDYVRRKNYVAAVVGLDQIQSGLLTMHNAKCGDFRSHDALFALCEGLITAFGVPDSLIYEDKRREVALISFEDAHYLAGSTDLKNTVGDIITDLKSGVPLTEIKEKHYYDFPQSVIEILEELKGELKKI